MVFSSAAFLFAFLPVLFVLYKLVPGIKAKNIVLAVFSLIFYCFGQLKCLPLLLASVVMNWGLGLMLGNFEKKSLRRFVIILAVILNVGALAAFKYLGFFAENINGIFGTGWTVPGFALPLGISFFTFTGLGYVLEVYRKPARMSKSFLRVLLFISLFPNILSGPILNWKDFSGQLDERACSPEKTARGIRRFVFGLGKKVLVADIVGAAVDSIFSGSVLDARLAWLGVIGYAVQIYFDFSGYTDMALGLGFLFGFDFPENFRQPYAALDMTDFWKRWHMTLTGWFRTYLYMPLVMSKPLQKLYKRWAAKYGRPKANRMSVLIPSAVVWLLTGLWHGAAWTYVLWGLWHGLFCVLEGVGMIRTAGLKKTGWGRLLLHLYTMLVILFGSLLFRSGSLSQAWAMLCAMLTGWQFTPEATYALQKLCSGLNVLCLCVGIVGCFPVVPWLREHTGRWGEPLSYLLCAFVFVLSVSAMAGSGFQPFIYLQF